MAWFRTVRKVKGGLGGEKSGLQLELSVEWYPRAGMRESLNAASPHPDWRVEGLPRLRLTSLDG